MSKHFVLLIKFEEEFDWMKLRRKNQRLREDNPELEKGIPITNTIDNQRENDDIYIIEEDPELI